MITHRASLLIGEVLAFQHIAIYYSRPIMDRSIMRQLFLPLMRTSTFCICVFYLSTHLHIYLSYNRSSPSAFVETKAEP